MTRSKDAKRISSGVDDGKSANDEKAPATP